MTVFFQRNIAELEDDFTAHLIVPDDAMMKQNYPQPRSLQPAKP